MIRDSGVIVASESGIHIGSLADVSDAIAACFGKKGLILTEDDLSVEFFDLSTRLAGELFQKCMNYATRLAIIVPDAARHGERFAELAYEHRSHNMIRFFASRDEAKAWMES